MNSFKKIQIWILFWVKAEWGGGGGEEEGGGLGLVIFSSPEHEVLMVSYCDQSMSVVRRASCVVRRQQFVLKANSSWTLGPLSFKLHKNVA